MARVWELLGALVLRCLRLRKLDDFYNGLEG